MSFITLTLHILAYSLIIYLFWGWFIVGTFQTIPEITFGKAVGLAAFINLVVKDEIKIDTKNSTEFSYIVLLLIKLTLVLFIGFVIHTLI